MKLYKKREILFIYLLHIKIINSFNKNQLCFELNFANLLKLENFKLYIFVKIKHPKLNYHV